MKSVHEVAIPSVINIKPLGIGTQYWYTHLQRRRTLINISGRRIAERSIITRVTVRNDSRPNRIQAPDAMDELRARKNRVEGWLGV